MTAIFFYATFFSLFEEFFLEARGGSAELRLMMYKDTIYRIFDYFVFGHGTQISVPYLDIPLGSHNWYLNIIFKYGLIGFIPFFLWLTLTVKKSLSNLISSTRQNLLFNLNAFFSILGLLLISFSQELVLDAQNLFLVAAIFSLPYIKYKRQNLDESN
jgi:O-antigen ligase